MQWSSLPDRQGTGKSRITIVIDYLLLQPFLLRFYVTLRQVTVVVSFNHK